MKNVFLFVLVSMALLTTGQKALAAEGYAVDMVHSSLGFSIRHMMVAKVNGAFGDYQGEINFDPADLANSKFDFTIKVASIDTRNQARDNHLKGADFFEADKYPVITFKTKKVEKAGNNSYNVTGDMTMKGVTRQEVIPVTIYGPVFNPMAKLDGLGVEADFKINRQDYGMTWNKTLDNGGLVLANDVEVQVNLETHRIVK